MSPRRLLIIGLACYAFSLQCLAQPASPTPSASNVERPAIGEPGADDSYEKSLILALSAAGVVVTVFAMRRLKHGVYDYHVNQFRIYFTIKEPCITSEKISSRLEAKFGDVFCDNSIASAQREFPGTPNLIRFNIK